MSEPAGGMGDGTVPGVTSGVVACILAGGRSSRMGCDKAMLPYRGRPLVEHALRSLQSLGCRTIVISGARPDLEHYAPTLPDLHPGCGPLGGMEAGLTFARALSVDYPAIPASPSATSTGRSTPHSRAREAAGKSGLEDAVLFLPVDLPLLPAGFLGLLLERAACSGALVTMPFSGGRQQPLCAVYRQALLAGITEALEAGNYKVMRVIESLATGPERDTFDVEAVLTSRGGLAAEGLLRLASAHPAAARPVASPHLWFSNVNTPRDLASLE